MLAKSRMIAWSRRLRKSLPVQASSSCEVTSPSITGISLAGVAGLRARSIGERSISRSSLSSQPKNTRNALCLFTAVEAERISIIQA
ncbi:hypothetical protein [Saccharopolyspora dendranthemae]|uniref:hypothetical protein n=1 Tax=Saccharopolyspora dendranthemae TaxID=1181886 RepID=UPI003CCC596D